MTYRMYVFNTAWWCRFSNHVTEVYKSDIYRNKTIEYAIDDELGKYGAVNILSTPFIEFETEEDAIIFKLKWSA
jgi:hypothetical protein